MQLNDVPGVLSETHIFSSRSLGRDVKLDFFLTRKGPLSTQMDLLLINDGQHMAELGLRAMLDEMESAGLHRPLLGVAIHAGEDRKMEYGIASRSDYLGRGARASHYTTFILDELLPFIGQNYPGARMGPAAFAGFSLGGLSALDIVWQQPGVFSSAAVFSGSLWWRSVDQDAPHYDDRLHRIMHQEIRQGEYKAGLRFFFQCGNKDEKNDRNHNGIIDSIDDTLDLIRELQIKGYEMNRDIRYLELPDGSHDIPTWAVGMRAFLQWHYGS